MESVDLDVLKSSARWLEEGRRVLLVTSPAKGDGKSTTAANLALTMACAERKVLLVDADLRRPSLHSKLELGNANGLTQLGHSIHASSLELLTQSLEFVLQLRALEIIRLEQGSNPRLLFGLIVGASSVDLTLELG